MSDILVFWSYFDSNVSYRNIFLKECHESLVEMIREKEKAEKAEADKSSKAVREQPDDLLIIAQLQGRKDIQGVFDEGLSFVLVWSLCLCTTYA